MRGERADNVRFVEGAEPARIEVRRRGVWQEYRDLPEAVRNLRAEVDRLAAHVSNAERGLRQAKARGHSGAAAAAPVLAELEAALQPLSVLPETTYADLAQRVATEAQTLRETLGIAPPAKV